MGYWFLVGMVVCTVALVVAVLAIERSSTHPLLASDSTLDPADGTRQLDSRIADTDQARQARPVAWLAVISAETERYWPGHIADGRGEIWLRESHLADMTVDRLASHLDVEMDREGAEVVSFIAGLDDILAGTSPIAFARRLDSVLELIDHHQAVAVIATVPDLSRLNLPGAAEFEASDLRDVTDSWNAMIAAAAERHGSVTVNLALLPPAGDEGVDASDPPTQRQSDREDALAVRIAPAIRAAMERVRSVRASGRSTE